MNLDELAGRFKSARKSGNSYKALCPCHDDRTSSLSIFLNQAGNLTVKCFVGCRREAILAAVGLTWQDLNGVAKRQDWTLDVPNELPPTTHPKLGKTSKQWTYLNRAGKVLCYVYRFETPAGKEFRPLTYWRTGTRAEWRWTAPPDPKPLYNRHKLAAKPEAIVILTEGEKAADAAAELFPEFVTVTTMNGAQSPHKSDFKPLAGREVWIWPDNDEPGQEYARATARLCLKAGAREVKVLEIKGDHPKGWDAADALAEGWRPVEGETFQDVHFVEENLKPEKGSSEIPLDPEPIRERVYGKKIYPYVIIDGMVHYLKRTKDNHVEVPLCNFEARITREVVHDDGAEVQSLFLIEGNLANGHKLPAIEVTTASFSGLSWVTAHWGNSPVVYAGSSIKDHLRCAIQRLSGSVPRCTVFGHYGWRKLGGEWYYLHAGGALGGGGNRTDIEVAADKGAMWLYHLPDPPEGGDLVKAIRASLQLKDIGRSKETGYSLLSATYRAPLGEAYRVDLSLFLAGYTGQMKSEMTAIALSHFGQEFTARNFPASFEDTETDLEMKAFRAKDTIFVVDDFKPKGSEADIHRLHARADRLFRGVGNQSGRGRRTATLQARPTYYPRGFTLSSGEDIPRGQSLRARLCIAEVGPGEVDKSVLTELQQAGASGLLAQAMAGYIKWLAPRIDEFKKTLPDKVRGYRKDSGRYAHSRFIDNYANLVIGLEMFLEYAQESGAITEHEKETLLAEGTAVLDSLMHAQADYQADSDESVRFFALLTSALISDRCHLIDLYSQGEPAAPRDYGWRQVSVRDKDGNEELKWRPVGSCIGWVDDEKLYLDPEATFAAVQKFAGDQKEPFPVTQRTLWRRLADRGLLVDRDLSDGRNRVTSVKKVAGKSKRVVVILKSSLISGNRVTTKKTSGNREEPHGDCPEGPSYHCYHFSTDRASTFSESCPAADEKNLGAYVINSGISGNRGVEPNTGAGSSGYHLPESVVTGYHSQGYEEGDDEVLFEEGDA